MAEGGAWPVGGAAGARRRGRLVGLALVALLAALAACDRGDAVELSAWRLEGEAGARAVELPARLPLDPGTRAWTLRHDLDVPEAWRGRALTLVVPIRVRQPLALRVDGVLAPPLVSSAPTSLAYRIPASPAARRELSLHGDYRSSFVGAVPSVPRISATEEGDPAFLATSAFNRWSIYLSIGIVGLMAFAYAASWALDRRPAHAWFAVEGAAGALIIVAFQGGVDVFGAQTDLWLSWVVVVAAAASTRFFFAHLRLGAPPRWLWPMVGATAALTTIAVWQPYQPAWILATQVMVFLHMGWVLVALVRRPAAARQREDARLFVVAWIFASTLGWLDLMRALGSDGLDVVLGPTGFTIFALLQIFVLTRENVRRHEDVAALNAELRRQVAERSRELAEALLRTPSGARPASLEPGVVVDGRYRVVRRLGAGGMGTVFEVARQSDGEHVAMKILSRQADPAALARFAREAQLAARLEHPHILGVLDIGVSPTLGLYFVMPLVSGGSLEAHRASFGDRRWALPLCAQIAAALDAMHRAGVIHRDLKPGNVLLDPGPPAAARIADFGVAALRSSGEIDVLAATAAGELTVRGALVGTPAYMAPELRLGAELAGPASDVFSFGVLAYELLAGTPAFAEPPVLLAGRGAPLPPPAAIPGLASEVWARLADALDADPARRPGAEVLAATLAAARPVPARAATAGT